MTLAVEEVAVLTAASMVMWRESAVAAAAVAVRVVVVVVEGRVLIVVDRGTFRGSAPAAGVAVEGLAAVVVVALGGLEAAAAVEVTASIVGSKGTSLGNVLAVQLLDS